MTNQHGPVTFKPVGEVELITERGVQKVQLTVRQENPLRAPTLAEIAVHLRQIIGLGFGISLGNADAHRAKLDRLQRDTAVSVFDSLRLRGYLVRLGRQGDGGKPVNVVLKIPGAFPKSISLSEWGQCELEI